jgi:hypothetical protein
MKFTLRWAPEFIIYREDFEDTLLIEETLHHPQRSKDSAG